MKNRLIIVENHEIVAEDLQVLLMQSRNFICDIAQSGEAMVELMKHNNYDAMIIDGTMLSSIKGSGDTTYPPAVILAKAQIKDEAEPEINLSDNVAMFYSYYMLEKPFRLNDLLDALDRMIVAVHWQLGAWHFQADKNYLVMGDGKTSPSKISLTEKENQILNYLCRAGGKTVLREKLLQDVWGYRSDMDTHTLETHIYRLRQKIESTLDKPEILISDKNGYRLNHLQKSNHNRMATHVNAQAELPSLVKS